MNAFTGQISLFGGTYPPKGYLFCNGQTLKIDDYQALYALLGTTYGGNGRTEFNLPDLRGRVPIHSGQSTNGETYTLGQQLGNETNTMTLEQLGPHRHTMSLPVPVSQQNATTEEPAGLLSKASDNKKIYGTGNQQTYTGSAFTTTFSETGGDNGSPEAINNVGPSTAMNFIIATDGIYPST